MRTSKTGLRKMGRNSCKVLALAAAIAACLPVFSAVAQSGQTPSQALVGFDIPAGDLSVALERFSTQSSLQLIYQPDLVAGKRVSSIKGQLSWAEALGRLLSDTDLVWERANNTTLVIKRRVRTSSGENSRQSRRDSTQRDELGGVQNPVRDLDKMVVVGSRLGVKPTDSALPVRVITREEIEMSGASSIAQALSYLPEVSVSNGSNGNIGQAGGLFQSKSINATSVQLRGLPLGTTLILIDGRRAGESSSLASAGLFDLSTIPLGMVEHIEVLPAGASAVYGGDGLAGVINIVLRKDAEGGEIRIRSLSADGYGEEQANGMWGKSWSRGSVSLMGSWGRNGNLTTAERELTADRNYTRFGGLDRRSTYYPNLANVYSLDGCPPEEDYCFVPLSQRGNLPGTNSAFATVRPGQNGLNLSPDDFSSGELSYGDEETKFRTNETNYGVSVSGKFQATRNVELFADLLFNKREIPAEELWLGVQLGEYGWGQSIVPADNPFNPFGVDVGVDYYFANTNVFTSYTQRRQQFSVGARGTWKKSHWELTALRAKDWTVFDGPGSFNMDLVAQALRSSDPQTALNVFAGDGSPPGSHELLSSLVDTFDADQRSDAESINGYIRGPILSLPAGYVHALVGAEIQKISFKSAYMGNPSVGGDDTGRAYYAEVRVPVIASRASEQRRELLAVTGAYRREQIGRSEKSANTGTLGIEYRPSETVLVRSTYSDAFKPIIAYNAYQPISPSPFPVTVRDPQFDGREFSVYPVRGGGVPPGLRPETSSNVTLGVVWNPSRDMRTSVTAWRSRVSDKFLTLPGTQGDFEYLINNESHYPGRVIRNPQSGFIEQVDLRVINVSSISLTGVDMSIDSRMQTAIGDIIASVGATYTHSYDVERLPESPAESRVSVIGNTGWAPRWKLVPRVVWHPNQAISTSLVGRYISGYRDTVPLFTGPNAGQILTFGNSWVVDMSVGIDLQRLLPTKPLWLDGAHLRLNVNNIGNKLPVFCNGCGGGYDATQADIMGRSIAAELVLSF